MRIINHSRRGGEVRIEAIDDGGSRRGPLALAIGARATVHLNSTDFEAGNADKGFPDGAGTGEGDWRLALASDLDIEVLAFIRTADGMLASVHDAVPADGPAGERRVATFNPGSNYRQVSLLRLVNAGSQAADVRVTAIDGHGAEMTGGAAASLPAGTSRTFTAAELEAGADGLRGTIGDGHGKWRLLVEAPDGVAAMSLLSSPTGHLTNLSTAPRNEAGGAHAVPLFPSASDPGGLQGFVRAVNHGSAAEELRIEAFDDAGQAHGPLTLTVGAGEAVHFNSGDMEAGNPEKGLTGATGPGQGSWRLRLAGDATADMEVLAYIRTPKDGFLTAMHDTAPSAGTRYRVATFNPGSNYRQLSLLRLANPNGGEATVSIQGIDDRGLPGREAAWLTVPAQGARTVDAATLESGGAGLLGALGDGAGKWQLAVNSDLPLMVMSLLQSPTGHLMNLSTAPARGAAGLPPPPDAAEHARLRTAALFRDGVSGPVVQDQCVACHAPNGAAGRTGLVFASAGEAGHEAANIQAFGSFLASGERAAELVLDKAAGADHEGGLLLVPGSEGYVSLEEFLSALGGSG